MGGKRDRNREAKCKISLIFSFHRYLAFSRFFLNAFLDISMGFCVSLWSQGDW